VQLIISGSVFLFVFNGLFRLKNNFRNLLEFIEAQYIFFFDLSQTILSLNVQLQVRINFYFAFLSFLQSYKRT